MRFYTVSHKHYCGVDLHTQVMYLCILNQEGDPRRQDRVAAPTPEQTH